MVKSTKPDVTTPAVDPLDNPTPDPSGESAYPPYRSKFKEDDENHSEDDRGREGTSISTYIPESRTPPPSTSILPSASNFLTTLGKGKEKASSSKDTAKALGMSDKEVKEFLLLATLFRQNTTNPEDEKFSVAPIV